MLDVPELDVRELDVREVPAAVTSELRRAVLRPQWEPGTPMPGDDLPGAVHLAALQDGVAVGACFVLPRGYARRPGEPAPWQLRGMATDAGLRGKGVGGLVLQGALDAVRGRGATLVWCMARAVAVPFYARHGFTVDSEEYVEPHTGLPHHDMSLALGA